MIKENRRVKQTKNKQRGNSEGRSRQDVVNLEELVPCSGNFASHFRFKTLTNYNDSILVLLS